MKKYLPALLSAFLFHSSFTEAQYSFQYNLAPTGGGKGSSITTTNDGGYILAGYNQWSTSASRDMVLIKTDANGTVQWSKKYGYSTGMDECYYVRQTSDGGYVMCGTTSGLGGSILKINSGGSVQWAAHPGNAGDIYKVIETNDGGFAYAGR